MKIVSPGCCTSAVTSTFPLSSSLPKRVISRWRHRTRAVNGQRAQGVIGAGALPLLFHGILRATHSIHHHVSRLIAPLGTSNNKRRRGGHSRVLCVVFLLHLRTSRMPNKYNIAATTLYTTRKMIYASIPNTSGLQSIAQPHKRKRARAPSGWISNAQDFSVRYTTDRTNYIEYFQLPAATAKTLIGPTPDILYHLHPSALET